MHADIKGALAQLNKSWRAFVHKGNKMSKDQVKAVLEYALDKGYKTTNQLSDDEVDSVIGKSGKAVEPKKLLEIIFTDGEKDVLTEIIDKSSSFPFTQDQINNREFDYVCQPCGVNFLTKAQLENGDMRISTFHDSVCGLCKKETSVTHIRHFNYLQIPKL